MVVNELVVNSFSDKFDPGDNKSGRDTEIIFYKVEKWIQYWPGVSSDIMVKMYESAPVTRKNLINRTITIIHIFYHEGPKAVINMWAYKMDVHKYLNILSDLGVYQRLHYLKSILKWPTNTKVNPLELSARITLKMQIDITGIWGTQEMCRVFVYSPLSNDISVTYMVTFSLEQSTGHILKNICDFRLISQRVRTIAMWITIMSGISRIILPRPLPCEFSSIPRVCLIYLNFLSSYPLLPIMVSNLMILIGLNVTPCPIKIK